MPIQPVRDHAPHAVRADIEGLRALAVLAVIANHAFPTLLPGGFVGVDVFFAISGYLIGKNVLLSLQDGTFSLGRFYGKRARRIFPALATVLLGVWCMGYLLLTGPEFIALGKHMAVSAVFANNFLLWTESGYFDAPATSKPLLHLWSLGIEEQFYLAAPCLLWLSLKFEGRPIAWVARLGLMSLLSMMLLSASHPASSFYLLHTRFWELAAGIGLAYFQLQNRASSAERAWSPVPQAEIRLHAVLLLFAATMLLASVLENRDSKSVTAGLALALLFLCSLGVAYTGGRRIRALSSSSSTFSGHLLGHAAKLPAAFGLAVICISCVVFSPRDWPGVHTIWPVLGTLLVLAAAPTAPVNKLLARKSMAWIGSISYPLYLWHWPLLVMWRLVQPQPTAWDLVAPLAISVALAWATKRFIEDPIRFGLSPGPLRPLPKIWIVSCALAFACSLGVITIVTRGLPSHYSEEFRSIADWSEPAPQKTWRLHRCYHFLNNELDFAEECTPQKRAGIPRVLLWGDSHAGQLYPGLTALQDEQSFDVAQWTTGSCPPSFTPIPGEGPACPAKRTLVLSMLGRHVPDTVLLAGAWELYSKSVSHDRIVSALGETVRRLREIGVRRIVIFGPGPIWKNSLQSELFIHMRQRRNDQVVERLGGSRASQIPERLGTVPAHDWILDAAMAAKAKATGAHYFSVLTLLCNTEGCLTVGDRTSQKPDLLFWDSDHLTISGSVLVMKKAKNLIFTADAP